MKFDTRKFSKELNNRLGLYLLGAILLAVVFWFLAIKPLWVSAQNSKIELNETKTEITELQELEKDTEELRANYVAIQDRRDQILNLLPPSEEEEKILLLLSEYADNAGVLLSTFAPEGAFLQSEQFSGFETYPININISGGYASVVKFIETLEAGARFVDIVAVTFNGEQATTTSVEAQLNLNAYYQTLANAPQPAGGSE